MNGNIPGLPHWSEWRRRLSCKGGSLGATEMATQAVRKGGTIQITGAYW